MNFITIVVVGSTLILTIPNEPYLNSNHCVAAEQVWWDNEHKPGDPEVVVAGCFQGLRFSAHMIEGVINYRLLDKTEEFQR